MSKEEYNQEPVYYCTRCLSLKIRGPQIMGNLNYCDNCGSTDIEQTDIETWENLYVQKYGHKYLEEY